MTYERTHLDLFSGIGGFSLAFESAGFRTIGFSEIEPHCCRVLRKHWPRVRNYGDINNVPRQGSCDVITGGFPCQPVSVGGEQRGTEDDRWKWPEMLSVVAGWKPIFVVAENVPGIIGMELDNVLSDLEAHSYATRAFVVPACAVGARHLRNRVWIIAYSESLLVEKQKVVSSARKVSKPRNAGVGLSRNLWKPNRETYLSDMAGIVYGVSEWVDRSKALGNSIVPQVAQIFAQIIGQSINQIERLT